MENRFVLEDVYGDAGSVFTQDDGHLEDCLKSGWITVDANILLRPYKMERHDFGQMIGLYERLIKEDRFFLSARVVREFAKNRPDQLAEVHQKLQDYMSKCTIPPLPVIPMFLEHALYQPLPGMADEIIRLTKEYRRDIKHLLETLEYWHGKDEISQRYNEIFRPSLISETALERKEISTQWTHRLSVQRPPGYKDSAKADDGIGDFLVWLDILEHAKDTQRSTVLVTDERKADWWHKGSSDTPLFPRHELRQEYNEVSGGGTFHLVSLARFAEIMELNVKVEDPQHVPNEAAQEWVVLEADSGSRMMCPATIRKQGRFYQVRVSTSQHQMEKANFSMNDLYECSVFIATDENKIVEVIAKLNDLEMPGNDVIATYFGRNE